MRVITSPTFDKQFKKLSNKVQQQFRDRLALWLENSEHPILRVHTLHGELQGYWSMNISGDYRVVYYFNSDEDVVLALIGTHSQLY
jgi:mRNA interferase RelE/StbE